MSDDFPCTKKGLKYFVGYKNYEKATTLCVLLPKMSGYVKNFDDAKNMSFLGQRLLVKYNEIGSKIKKIIIIIIIIIIIMIRYLKKDVSAFVNKRERCNTK